MDISAPRWMRDIERLLPIRSQFVLSGNIRDSFLTQLAGGPALVPLQRCLWEGLARQGYACLLIFDPSDGVRVYPDEAAQRERAERLFDLKLAGGSQLLSLESLAKLMKTLAAQRECRAALLMDFASRIVREPNHLGEPEHRFFVAAEKLALQAAAVVPKEGGLPLYNPILWLVNRPQELPSWFTLDNDKIAGIVVARPGYEEREAAAGLLAPLFEGYAAADESARKSFIQTFAAGAEGLNVAALADVTELASRQKLGMRDIDAAIRCYKVGAPDNPWQKDYLRARIRDALATIEERVKGQRQAVVKTLDILKRSAVGLTGAQARSGGGRPRGVLFFAGPTGVGKTELAKALTQLVFSDERALIRFDMSEFAEEHSAARLLGAPPGYIGFDAGGELTNAVRERPFSVLLFDEIEKAHPRILDKFLQILEDGRLTDGRGDTAYFSEAIIVFTSNLGIYVNDEHGRRIQQVRPGDPYELVEARVRGGIVDYFKYHLSRPEILNRIGDNIVVFNFITPDVARDIFMGMLRNVRRRLAEEQGLELALGADVAAELLKRATQDLSNGGRGIGNQLESAFINPLARALFALDLAGASRVRVAALSETDKVVSLTLETS
ncbi:MAG: ATP-dependent Clp protease ATP-binding subunit [Rhodocyclaceae bacterium]|nr:ATP-dependent Clp protease ATP-binding subunit [Rhodocyclaceae bacterium]